MSRTKGDADPDLARTLVDNAGETVEWITAQGVEWNMEPLAVGYTVGRTWMDGEDFVARMTDRVPDMGGDIYYEAEARSIERDDAQVTGLTADVGDECKCRRRMGDVRVRRYHPRMRGLRV